MNSSKKLGTVSIVGAGFLGAVLAKNLSKQNYAVHVSSTRWQRLAELRKIAKTAIVLRLTGAKPVIKEILESEKVFFSSDCFIICVPPRKRELGFETRYLAEMQEFLQRLKASNPTSQSQSKNIAFYTKRKQRVIFISSTAVYASRKISDSIAKPCLCAGNEERADSQSGAYLRQVERLFLESPCIVVSIVRLGGLIGKQRYPGRFLRSKLKRSLIHNLNSKAGKAVPSKTVLAKKIALPEAESPVNLIHVEDASQLCLALLKKNKQEAEIINGVAPSHPTKGDFYKEAARCLGLLVPIFESVAGEAVGKIVCSEKAERLIKFRFPDMLKAPHDENF